jgi:hypothetical protein
MWLLFILTIAGFMLLIAAIVLTQGRRSLARASRLLDYWTGLFVLAVACFLPVLLLVWAVHTNLIPIPQAVEAVGCFDPDLSKFEDNLENEEQGNLVDKHAKALKDAGASEDEICRIQNFLWTRWPTIVAAGLVLFFIGIHALAHAHRALLRDIEASDNCPPGGAGSYVGAPTLDSSREFVTDFASGEQCEMPSHLAQRHGNRSIHEICQRDELYERIAVASDDVARGILISIAQRGPAHVIKRLAEDLHEPGHHEIRETPSRFPEHYDEVYEERGYVLIWNARRLYVSLAYAVKPDARVTS